ncbi:iron-containing redox enzyme family protein [Bdellovibrio sp. GT3]|uniref:iron-containing redox enzyme family protein n=1 Tax=unclassified Bdellovibrio TaxID=2633795 RepID=UPI0030F20DD4
MKPAEFRAKATAKVDEMCNFIETMPWESVNFYSSWVAQTNAFVAHTSTFLNMCNDLLPKSHPLKAQFEHHIEEEAGHEKMSKNDLKFMRSESSHVFNFTDVFWKTQYYWIKEVGPTSHLGYSLFLEGLAAKSGPKVLNRIKAAGIKGYTFLKVHAEEDVEHFQDVLKAVDQVTDLERAHIYQNLCESMEIYYRIMNECAKVAHPQAA